MRHILSNSINFFLQVRSKVSYTKKILVYADAGSSLASAIGLCKRLASLVDSNQYTIQLATANLIKHSSWESETQLFVMPGGRSKPFYTSLQEAGNEKIVNYVKAGGNYLGICAGAYYGSTTTEFEKDHPLQLILDGPLNFFPGKAVGPAYGPGKFQYNRQIGARLAKIQWNLDDEIKQQVIGVYYNGGCFFELGTSHQKNIQVLANYFDIENKPPAIIACKIDRGRAILSGVHVETNAQLFRLNPFKDQKIYEGLLRFETLQTKMLRIILNDFNIHCPDNKFYEEEDKRENLTKR